MHRPEARTNTTVGELEIRISDVGVDRYSQFLVVMTGLRNTHGDDTTYMSSW